MRRIFFVLFVLCGATSLFAGTFRFSGFNVNGAKAFEFAENGHVYAAAVDYSWTSHISSALSISDEPVKLTRFRLVNFDGIPGSMPYLKSIHLHPVDAVLRYHFDLGARLHPYVGSGVRYISAEGTNNYRGQWETGVTVAITRHLGIEANYKRLYNQNYGGILNSNGTFQDMRYLEGRPSRTFVGLSWSL